MRRRVCTIFLALVAPALLLVESATAEITTFRANVQDTEVCPGVDLCGTGVIQGFGHVTTTLSFATFERVFVLADGSTLRLTLQPTGMTGVRLNGTWLVIGGTGVFASASGSGVLWATPTGLPVTSDTAHFRGTIDIG
jgi:hypothetical protein